jgi:hypothetical protein
MRARHPALPALALALSTAAACGGGDPTGPGGLDGTGMVATVDGAPWVAHELSIAAGAGGAGSFTIVGAESNGGTSRSITLALYNIRGIGTYPLGTSSFMVGGRAQFSEAGTVWATPSSGVAGIVTLTDLTPTHIAGTFEYVAEISSGSSGTQSHTVTNGAFDMPLQTTGTLPAVPDNAGHVVKATVRGTPFNAASAHATTSITGGGLGFNANDLTYQIGLSLSTVNATGTYTLDQPAGRLLFVTGMGVGSPNCCWGATASDVGTITITSVTATRMKGTFSGTLQPQSGSGQTQALVIANGTFDIGR